MDTYDGWTATVNPPGAQGWPASHRVGRVTRHALYSGQRGYTIVFPDLTVISKLPHPAVRLRPPS